MRIRQIKPEFYLDDELAQSCSRDARLLFTGLWVIADRKGRLEDRPAKIKAQVFPYDDDITAKKIDGFLASLASGSFIVRYSNGAKNIIQIRTFEKHQHCHVKEPESKLPGPEDAGSSIGKNGASTVQEPDKHRSSPSASCILSTASGVRLLDNVQSDSKNESSSQVAMLLPLADKSEYPINECCIEQFKPLYPGIDVRAECLKAKAWLIANPTRAKTKAGIMRFLNHWLAKAQDNGSRAAPSSSGDQYSSGVILETRTVHGKPSS